MAHIRKTIRENVKTAIIFNIFEQQLLALIFSPEKRNRWRQWPWRFWFCVKINKIVTKCAK